MYACLAVTCHLHFWQNDRADYETLYLPPAGRAPIRARAGQEPTVLGSLPLKLKKSVRLYGRKAATKIELGRPGQCSNMGERKKTAKKKGGGGGGGGGE